MNMPPPSAHGAGSHSQSQSPGMQHHAYPQSNAFLQQQQQYQLQQQQQQQQQAYLDSGRGRKRKLTTQNAHLVRRPSGHGNPQMHPGQHMYQHQPQHPHHPQHQQQQQQQQQQHGPGYARHPQSAFLGLNLPPSIADELPDSIVDDLDRLTPRDLAVARYARNHELLSTVFDARRIDSLHPAPSPYSQVQPEELQAKVDTFNSELSQLASAHADKMARVKQIMSGKLASDDASAESQDMSEPETWARGAFRGRVLGLGFVRATTPEELKPKRKPSTPQAQQSATEAANATAEEEKRRKEETEAIERLNASLGPESFEASDRVAPPAPPSQVPSAPVLPHSELETADAGEQLVEAKPANASSSDAAIVATGDTVDQAETVVDAAAAPPAPIEAGEGQMQDAITASNNAALSMDSSTQPPIEPTGST